MIEYSETADTTPRATSACSTLALQRKNGKIRHQCLLTFGLGGCAWRNWGGRGESGLRDGQQSHFAVRAAHANRPAIARATGGYSTTTVQMTNDKMRPQ